MQVLISQFERLIQSSQISHAHVIEGAFNKQSREVINELVKRALCLKQVGCGNCQACQLLTSNTHPDIKKLPQETGAAIKVEDIRELHQYVYQSPKISRYRVIFIEGVDYLNRSAANALLKMLEEPPSGILFLLSCQYLANVIATIRSRSVHWKLADLFAGHMDWEQLIALVDDDSDKHALLSDRLDMMTQIERVYQNLEHPSVVAATWQKYSIKDLLWFLYLLHADGLKNNYVEQQKNGYWQDNEFLLKQISKIHAMIRLANKGVSLNCTLMCEALVRSRGKEYE